MYHQELARELSDFLSAILDKAGGMMSLVDIYCMYNRARGIALISPEDLYKACHQLERCQLPQRLKAFESGLLVVHSGSSENGPLFLYIFNISKPRLAMKRLNSAF
jgi:ESCRT-II complex subunit VPS36